jgi:gamma-glutamyltranspeptidase/glutathione hydrolase
MQTFTGLCKPAAMALLPLCGALAFLPARPRRPRRRPPWSSTT